MRNLALALLMCCAFAAPASAEEPFDTIAIMREYTKICNEIVDFAAKRSGTAEDTNLRVSCMGYLYENGFTGTVGDVLRNYHLELKTELERRNER